MQGRCNASIGGRKGRWAVEVEFSDDGAVNKYPSVVIGTGMTSLQGRGPVYIRLRSLEFVVMQWVHSGMSILSERNLFSSSKAAINQTWHAREGYKPSIPWLRARERYRLRNSLTGLVLVGFIGGVCMLSPLLSY